ncbi:lipopolysaccharide biosynthesis protein [Methylocystis heyeri]|uniref:Oligosaccharide flippase family protein n=1 Tax=Methylocystis heyeri TaxID=391905 RepID=A0A6B8KDM0_9HYPH|nr:lipopolysaccharide biosynthesis protein [Methylocystis heyeri]QGM44523.1 oligosaccharide flippase family protein [Methylocystis heyeri]
MWMMLVFTANSLLNFVVSLLVAKFLGPAEYGRFTVALAASVILELLCFDWLRLAATRFYSQRDQAEKPQVRATLDRAFVWIGLAASAASIGAFFIGPDLPLSPDLVSLAIGVAITNGMFDFSCALLRSRFLDRPYGVLVIVKNILAFLLTVGGAFALGSARIALLGLMVSAAGSLVAAREGLIDPNARRAAPDRALALRFLGYGLPIIAANILYQSTPLLNRVVVSQSLGFAEAGQLSLAFEIGVRIVGAIGSALDVILFQIAVRAEKTIGAQGARAQVSRNMGVVFAIVVPAVLGCWLILPSFESLFVPQNYRGPFAHYFTLMAPALAAFALINYALNPAYQISHRLAPLIIGALFAVLVNLLAIEFLPSGADAAKFALAQSLSSLAGMLALFLMLFLLEPMWPRARDVLGTLFASALMLAAALPLRALTPGPLAMGAQIAVGAAVYLATAAALDLAGLRTLLLYRPRVSARADC